MEPAPPSLSSHQADPCSSNISTRVSAEPPTGFRSIRQASPSEIATVGPKHCLRMHGDSLTGLIFVHDRLIGHAVEVSGLVVKALCNFLQPPWVVQCAYGVDRPRAVVVPPTIVLDPAFKIAPRLTINVFDGSLRSLGERNFDKYVRPGTFTTWRALVSCGSGLCGTLARSSRSRTSCSLMSDPSIVRSLRSSMAFPSRD